LREFSKNTCFCGKINFLTVEGGQNLEKLYAHPNVDICRADRHQLNIQTYKKKLKNKNKLIFCSEIVWYRI